MRAASTIKEEYTPDNFISVIFCLLGDELKKRKVPRMSLFDGYFHTYESLRDGHILMPQGSESLIRSIQEDARDTKDSELIDLSNRLPVTFAAMAEAICYRAMKGNLVGDEDGWVPGVPTLMKMLDWLSSFEKAQGWKFEHYQHRPSQIAV